MKQAYIPRPIFLSNILDDNYGVFTASPAIGIDFENMQIRLLNLYITILFF